MHVHHPNQTRAIRRDAVGPTCAHASVQAATVASTGAFCFGYALGVVNGPLYNMAQAVHAKDAASASWIVGASLLGACAGSAIASAVADAQGRKKAMAVAALPMIAGPMASAIATTYPCMVGGRAVLGVGIGMASALVPLYLSEVSPTQLRGQLGSFNQLAICMGILGALMVNAVVGQAGWRIAVAIGIVPAAALLLACAIIPESPRWLNREGREGEALVAARRLWGEDAEAELGVSHADVDKPSNEGMSWKAAILNRKTRVALGKGAVLFLLQQFAGINAIVFFSTAVFERAGMTSGAMASATVGLVNVLGTFFASRMIDRAGRKPLLASSFAMMGASMMFMAVGVGWTPLQAFSGVIALMGTLVYVFGFAIGAGPVPSLLMPEILPASVRGKGVSLAMLTHWISNFAVGQLFLPTVERVGLASVYFGFAVVCMCGVVFIGRAIQETTGLSLEQIEEGPA